MTSDPGHWGTVSSISNPVQSREAGDVGRTMPDKYTKDELLAMERPELRELAQQYGMSGPDRARATKNELAEYVFKKQGSPGKGKAAPEEKRRPGRPPGRPKKAEEPAEESAEEEESSESSEEEEAKEPVKKRPGRPKKVEEESAEDSDESSESEEDEESPDESPDESSEDEESPEEAPKGRKGKPSELTLRDIARMQYITIGLLKDCLEKEEPWDPEEVDDKIRALQKSYDSEGN